MRIVVWLTVIGVALGTAPAKADSPAPPPAAGKPAPPPPLSPTTEQDLKSPDPAKVKAALDDIRMGGKANARLAPTIADLLQRGLPFSVTEAAIDTLGDLQSEATSPVLASYAQYRTTKIRQAAVRALLKTKGAAAVRAFRRGLSDADPMIRGLSATGLGTLKAKDALPDLLLALDHRVDEASVAIGQLCGPAECDALAAKIGRLPFDVVTSGLDQALFRADVPEDNKIKVIGKLRELGTADANKYLRDVAKRGASLSPRLKQAIDQAVQATPGGAP